MKRRLPISLLVALLASLVLHVGLLVWLRAQVMASAAPPPAAPMELTFVEVEPVRPPEEPPAPAEKPKVAAKAPSPRLARVAAPSEPVPPAPPVTKLDAPMIDDRPVSLTLAPGSSFAMSLDAGLELPEVTPQRLHAPESTQALVAETARETLGRGKVDRGLVHPYYQQLGKALMKNWDADRAVSQGGLKAYTQQMGENFKLSNEIWLSKAEQYAKTGSPLGDAPLPELRTGPTNDRIGGLPAPDLAARKELQKQMREAYKATRHATLKVVQAADGKLLSVELVEPSNDAKIDREAMVDVRAAADKLPAPPPEVVGSRKQIISLWSFELVISISPPIPTFTFEFDEVIGFIDARMPLDRRIYKKVRLIAVE